MNRTPEWHEARRKHLGASEVATILNVSPYSSAYEVWAVKQGKMAPFEGNEATRMGQRLESALLDEAEDDLGAIERDVPVPHKSLPLVATLDGQAIADQSVIECKTAGLLSGIADDWGEPGMVEFCEQVPKHYFVQVQAQLLCTGAELAHLYALLPRRGICKYQVIPDRVLHDWMARKIDEWWQRHMVEGEPPALTNVSLDTLKRLSRNEEATVDLDDEVRQFIDDYQLWAEEERKCKKRKEDFQKDIIAALGEAAAGKCKDGTIVSMPLIERKGYTVEPKSYRQLRIKKASK